MSSAKMMATVIATQIVEAVALDETLEYGGCDISAGMLGPKLSEWIRQTASHLTEPIDMVLHCPACGMQHIDADNHDEIRIKAAELGIDREGDRAYSEWLEEQEWTNPPHRSHLCHGCNHIWRPADVPTNGVRALKTTGKADSSIIQPVRK